MNFIQASIFMLFIAVISVPLAARAKLPLEIFLFIGSCLLSLIPGLSIMHIHPTVVFDILLPPILFSAAYFTSWREFKYNLRPITQLAFGLVLFTALAVAVIAKQILPSLSWPEAFLLGAILSPTDASAATSILKRFPVPRRFIVLLEGESLINDATALILYRFSLA
ncbi:MAG: cation:proton antiporter, partial [Gammaproteobacteria bacterium]